MSSKGKEDSELNCRKYSPNAISTRCSRECNFDLLTVAPKYFSSEFLKVIDSTSKSLDNYSVKCTFFPPSDSNHHSL
jgi:hypothetical protein